MNALVRWTLSRTTRGKELLSCWSLRPYLNDIGWLRSAQERVAVDRDGNPLPWFTYPAISYLRSVVTPEMDIFEYGSGNSTLWWSRLVHRVTSCEHDLAWYKALQVQLPANVTSLHHALEPGGAYSQAAAQYQNAFDVIVIDGRDRVNCARNSLGSLKNNGVIIWDNSDRDEYKSGYAFLAQHGFRRLDFAGHGPINNYSWCTSLFYRGDNCFGV